MFESLRRPLFCKPWEGCEAAKQRNLVFNCVHQEESYILYLDTVHINKMHTIYMQLRNVCFNNANIYNIYIYSYVYMYLLVSLTFLFWSRENSLQKDLDLLAPNPDKKKTSTGNKSLWHRKCQSAYQSSLDHFGNLKMLKLFEHLWFPKVGMLSWAIFTWNVESIGSIPAILKPTGWTQVCGGKIAKSKHRIVIWKVLRPHETWGIIEFKYIYVYVLCHGEYRCIIVYGIWIHDELKTTAFTI